MGEGSKFSDTFAQLLFQQHGDKAIQIAQDRAKGYESRGEAAHYAYWLSVLESLVTLQKAKTGKAKDKAGPES